ncbi:MAG: hypothetical protein RLZZ613_1533 [Pseudomonadota bacterium]
MLHVRKPTVARAEHHWHVPDQHICGHVNVVSLGVLDIHVYWRCVGHVSHTALLRRDVVGNAVFFDRGLADPDVGKLEVKLSLIVPEATVGVRGNQRVGPNDLFDFAVDEVVERVDVLLHQAADAQERGHQLPFVLP